MEERRGTEGGATRLEITRGARRRDEVEKATAPI
jgi:hypothetical protein